MSRVKKYIVVPSEQIEGDLEKNQLGGAMAGVKSNEKVKRKTKNFNIWLQSLQIALKLAKIDAYEIDGRIRSIDGHLIDGTNIVDLLEHVVSPKKSLEGLNEFVKLLYKAGVEPELVHNIDVKNKLMGLYMDRAADHQNKGDVSREATQVFKNIDEGVEKSSENLTNATQSATSVADDNEGFVTADEGESSQIPGWVVPDNEAAHELVEKEMKTSPRKSKRMRKEKFTINAGRGKRGTGRIQWIES